MNHRSRFAADEDGAATVWALSWTILFLALGGLTVDAGNAWRMQSMLQATADAAALSAIIELNGTNATAAKAEGIRIANLNLANGVLGNGDIVAGAWNPTNRTLNSSATVFDAIQVTTRRSSVTGNGLPTFLLKIIGFNSWNVSARATAQRFVPGCLRNGLTARGRVEVSSNNAFVENICLHGQTGVKISSNNTFQAGVKVTMPDLSMLQIPASGMTSNVGLPAALGEDNLDPYIVDHVSEIVTALQNPSSSRQPAYIDKTKPAIAMTRTTFNAASALTAGRVYVVNCTGGSGININNSLAQNVVITTNCGVTFGKDSQVTNAVIATSNTSTTSISGSSGTKIGANDNCAAGGGAQLLTAGSVHFAAGLSLFGAQVIATGNVTIAAQANGIEGAAVQAGGDIKLTSNSSWGRCNTNVDMVYFQSRYRLVN